MANPQKLLAELGIDRDSYRVLGLLPLVYVAWADGTIQRSERSVIVKAARDKGWLRGGGEAVLNRWLDERPTQEQFHTGLTALKLLSEQHGGVGGSIHAETLPSLLALCKNVAQATAGLFGCADAIGREEEGALEDIAKELGVDDGNWREAADQGALDADPPGPKGGLVLGSALDLKDDILGFVHRMFREHGDAVRLRVLHIPMYCFFRPEQVQYILADNADNYRRGRDFEAIAGRVGQMMITTEGEVWRRLRRIAQPLFKPQQLSPFFDKIVAIARSMLESWEARRKEPIDMMKEMSKVTMRVIGELVFSRDLSDEATELGRSVDGVVHHIGQLFIDPFMLPQAIPTGENRRFGEAVKVFDAFIYDLIRARQSGKDAPTDLLGLLLGAKDEETGKGLSDEEIRNETLQFLIAGHETTATALTWSLYFASTHPTAMRAVEQEAAAVLGDEPPTLDQLDRLERCERFVFEAMRLRPPFYGLTRDAVAEDFIGGYRVPKGAVVLVSQWVTHRHPDIWDNPEGFDPDRFSPERSEGRHKMAWFPFGAGPHKCIGMPLSLMEMKVILPMIAQRYRVELLPGAKVEVEPQLTTRPKGGLPMRLRPR